MTARQRRGYSLKSKRALEAFLKNAGPCRVVTEAGSSEWLLLWGFGGDEQQAAFKRQREAGGNVVCLDMGYWFRDVGGVRLSINGWHPQQLMRLVSGDRQGYTPPLLDDQYFDPNGHILIAGAGEKSRKLLGLDGMKFEQDAVGRISAAFPGRRIMYRPKPRQTETLEGTTDASNGDIRDHLRGCALAVVLHSNVAVDCAVHGVPCVAVDGAGAYAYPRAIESPHIRLLGEARRDFLNRVAWFNWLPHEFPQMRDFCYSLAEASHAEK